MSSRGLSVRCERGIRLDAHIGGIDTVRLLGAFRIGAPGVPVLVVSGSAEDEIRQLFAPHPYDAFLAKPYTISELRQALRAARGGISGNSQNIKL